MFNHYLTLYHQAQYLHSTLRGSIVTDSYTQDADELIFIFQKDDKQLFLEFSCHPRLFHIFLRPEHRRARKNVLDVFPMLIGKHVSALTIDTGDRWITITCEDLSLTFVLIPGKANAFVSYGGKIIHTFKKHKVPEKRTDNMFEFFNLHYLDRLAPRKEYTTLKEALSDMLPTWGKRLHLEICARMNCAFADNFTPGHFPSFIRTAREIARDLERVQPRIYFDDEIPSAFSLIELRQFDLMRCELFPDINEALRQFYIATRRQAGLALHRRRFLLPLQKLQAKLESTLEKLEPPESLIERAAQYEKYGFLLLSQPDPRRSGLSTLRAEDYDSETGQDISIPLRPDLNLLENANRYYRKAKQAKARVAYVLRRKSELVAFSNRVRSAIENLPAHFDKSALKSYIEAYQDVMRRLNMMQERNETGTRLPYRRFFVHGGFEVWAGKNNMDNDVLTLHYSDPNDLWFHVRGFSGSHVLLKVRTGPGEPSRQAIEEAASIAAYYSKQRKAKRVAVSYTLKKYVRKRKGSPPGTVQIEREKTILVPPRLPDATNPYNE